MTKNRFRKAIIIGASSGMGAETAKLLARGGCAVALVARREDELNALAEVIRSAGGTAHVYLHDVSDFGDIPALFQRICRDLGGLDAIFYAAGVMPRIAADEFDFAKDRAMIEVNVLGAIAWLNEAAARFAATAQGGSNGGAGTIVGIGSVAGDRGRRGQPVYCTSKAALETYLEALRNRVGRFGVRVVTVKPGPVDTPMTRGLDKLPLLIHAEEAARQIVAASERGARVAYVPGAWRYIMAIIRAIPSFIFQKMNL